ncbi:MAG: NAD(P)-binding domain-containing protein [Nakamurella sp.]
MPIYLTTKDLRPLLDSSEELDNVLAAIERSVLDQHQGPPGHVIFSGVPLAGEDQMLVSVNAAGTAPLTVRVFPAGWNRVSSASGNVMLAFDPQTGDLETIIQAAELNRLRTSIPVAVGARHLARKGSRVLGMLGSGDQARGTARTILRAVPSIEEIVVWSPTPENREAYAAEQGATLGVPIRPVTSADEVVAAADVLMMAGRIQPGDDAFDETLLKPGSTVLSMSGAAPRALTEGAGLYVPTNRRPRPVAIGFLGQHAPRPMTPPDDVRVLADVITGARPARDQPDEILLWEIANVYLWDQAIAAWVSDWARRTGTGTQLT